MAKKSKAGRPIAMTEGVINKLEEAFSWGCTDLEACIYADISAPVLYAYQKDDEDFKIRKEQLKQTVSLHAKRNVQASIRSGNETDSKWWLERKNRNEFSTKTETENAHSFTQMGLIPAKNEKGEVVIVPFNIGEP